MFDVGGRNSLRGGGSISHSPNQDGERFRKSAPGTFSPLNEKWFVTTSLQMNFAPLLRERQICRIRKFAGLKLCPAKCLKEGRWI